MVENENKLEKKCRQQFISDKSAIYFNIIWSYSQFLWSNTSRLQGVERRQQVFHGKIIKYLGTFSINMI